MVVNGKYGPVYTYTVKDYLNYLLEHDYPQQARSWPAPCWCMAAKRSCAGYRTDALAGTAEPNSTANWSLPTSLKTAPRPMIITAAACCWRPVIQIRHYFMVPDGPQITFTFAWNAGEARNRIAARGYQHPL